MGRICIGTCSWTDRSLVESGLFYPPWCTSPYSRLQFYASIFPTVEVDSTYYALPSPKTSVLWAQRTPNDFIFHIKMFRLFTFHWTEPASLPRDLQPLAPATAKGRFYLRDTSKELADALLKRFCNALMPLKEAGKLGVILLQFPPWVAPGKGALEHILSLQGRLEGFTLAVEFRNGAWLAEERREHTLQWLRAHRLVFVAVDEPQGFRSSVPPVAEVTGDVGYVRFHGRNRATWEASAQTSAARFDWYYSDEELEEWVPRLMAMREQARVTYALFNTNNGDQGPRNALKLAHLLGEGVRSQPPLSRE